jgi:glycosyltransferase involved in cell wall biosynthesis
LKLKFLGEREKDSFYRKAIGDGNFRYLLVVSTIEPRKNHARILAAWEVLKAEVDPSLKLVFVGSLGSGISNTHPVAEILDESR